MQPRRCSTHRRPLWPVSRRCILNGSWNSPRKRVCPKEWDTLVRRRGRTAAVGPGSRESACRGSLQIQQDLRSPLPSRCARRPRSWRFVALRRGVPGSGRPHRQASFCRWRSVGGSVASRPADASEPLRKAAKLCRTCRRRPILLCQSGKPRGLRRTRFGIAATKTVHENAEAEFAVEWTTSS